MERMCVPISVNVKIMFPREKAKYSLRITWKVSDSDLFKIYLSCGHPQSCFSWKANSLCWCLVIENVPSSIFLILFWPKERYLQRDYVRFCSQYSCDLLSAASIARDEICVGSKWSCQHHCSFWLSASNHLISSGTIAVEEAVDDHVGKLCVKEVPVKITEYHMRK